MKLIHCIRGRIGSHYKDEFNDGALAMYAGLKGLDPTLLVNETKRVNYEYYDSAILRESIKTNEDWRKLNWCYALVAWNEIQKENIESTSFGMGVLEHKEKTDSIHHYSFATRLYLSVSRFGCEVRRTDGDDTRMIRSGCRVDTEKWDEDASVTLQHVFQDSNNQRFDPEEMVQADGKFLSFYYELAFGNIKIVFHTTEKGFDGFSLIRSEIMNNLTPAARELLGEYAEIVR